MLTAFPDAFPLDALQTCYQIVANHQLVEQQETFALNAWNIQGYLLKVSLEDTLNQHGKQEFAVVDRQIDQFIETTQVNYTNEDSRENLTVDDINSYITTFLPLFLQLLAAFRNRKAV